MKKLRKPKKRERKAAQRRLDEVATTLGSAKECASCAAGFDKATCLDWQIQVSAEGDVVLTCMECAEPSI